MSLINKEGLKKLNLKEPYVWLATWFGAGFLSPAPGTWGSAAAIPLALLIYYAFGPLVFSLAIVWLTVIGFWASDRFAKATDTHDSKMIVIDEAAGQWIALLPVFYLYGINPFFVFLAFLLFRLFDITKPWPVSHFDKNVPGAMGVMGDDVIAGLIGGLCIIGLYYAGFG